MIDLHFALVVALVFMWIGAAANAQTVDWGKIENACAQQASNFDAALVGYSFSAKSGNIGVNSARTNSLSVKVFLTEEARVWSGVKKGEMERGVQEMRRLVEGISDTGPGGWKDAKASRAFWLHRICLNEVFLSEMNGIQSSRNTAQAPISPGRTAQAPASQELAERDVDQSIALAQQNQAKAEEKRKRDGRRRNRPDLEVNSCLTPNTSKPGFSGFTNNCSHPVRYTYCVVNPSVGTGAAFVDCSKQSGSGSVPANGEDFAHMKGGTEVHWVACKPPATAITRSFENGRLTADCIDLGA